MKSGRFESVVAFNHFDKKTAFGMHAHHNHNAEHSLAEFVNRESIGAVEHFNADTALTFAQIDEPLLLVFSDVKVWETDEKEGKH